MSFLIKGEHLDLGYEGQVIVHDISFCINEGDYLCILGENGAGKSTLVKAILSLHAPLRGKIEFSPMMRKNEVGYLPQQSSAQKSFPASVEEVVLSGRVNSLSRRFFYTREDRRVADENLERLGILSLKKKSFFELSGGQMQRVLLARALSACRKLLLLDEPTNHLDGPGRQMVARYLSRLKRGFLLVSHDRDFLDGCVDHILALNKTGTEVVRGDCSSWLREKQARDQGELARNQELRGEIRRLEQAVRRTGDWSDRVERTKYGSKNSGLRPDRGYVGHKAAKLMKRSKSLENRQKQAIEEKQGLLRDVERYDALKLITAPSLSSRCLLQARDASIALGGKPVLQGVNFAMEPGERVCRAGGNGCGKTSLLRLLLGETEPDTGVIQRASGLEISYVPQNTGFLQGNLMEWVEGQGIEAPLLLGVLRKLDFPRELFPVDMAFYSAGQKKKLLLAASLSQRAHLYVWDEPLNYIDLYARMQLEELIVREKPTLLFVEHDQAFCRAVATRTVSL